MRTVSTLSISNIILSSVPKSIVLFWEFPPIIKLLCLIDVIPVWAPEAAGADPHDISVPSLNKTSPLLPRDNAAGSPDAFPYIIFPLANPANLSKVTWLSAICSVSTDPAAICSELITSSAILSASIASLAIYAVAIAVPFHTPVPIVPTVTIFVPPAIGEYIVLILDPFDFIFLVTSISWPTSIVVAVTFVVFTFVALTVVATVCVNEPVLVASTVSENLP